MRVTIITPPGGGGPTVVGDFIQSYISGEHLAIHRVQSTAGWIGAHFSRSDILISALPLFWRPKTRYLILQIHGNYFLERNFYSLGGALSFLFPWTRRFSDLAVYPSFTLQQTVHIDTVTPSKIMYNTVSSDFVKAKSVFRFSEYREGTVLLITCTSFHFLRKAQGVIDLVTLLSKAERPIALTVVGEGKYRSTIEREVLNYLKRQNSNSLTVKFLGQINSRIQQIKLYERNHAFVYSSSLDTFGISILEAAYLGIPTVVTGDPVFQELFGLIYVPPDLFVEKLFALFGDKVALNKHLVEQARITNQYSPDIIGKNWKELISIIKKGISTEIS